MRTHAGVNPITYWLDHESVIASFSFDISCLAMQNWNRTHFLPLARHDGTLGGQIIRWTSVTSAEQTAGRQGVDVRRSHVFEMRQLLRNVCFSRQIRSATLLVCGLRLCVCVCVMVIQGLSAYKHLSLLNSPFRFRNWLRSLRRLRLVSVPTVLSNPSPSPATLKITFKKSACASVIKKSL